MSDWRPIETAPRDGTCVLLALRDPMRGMDLEPYAPVQDLNVVMGWWQDFDGDSGWECPFTEEGTADSWGYSSNFYLAVEPTHWMPLPEPPEDANDT